jgi:hypothetical protein
MANLRRFFLLPRAASWLVIKAALLLVAIKLGTWLLPFRTLRRLSALATIVPKWGLQNADHASATGIAWAVEAAGRRVPGTKSCLTQALATQVLLTRRGYPALLHIGVEGGQRERFRAHAWVESEGKVVIGGSGLERFTPLAILDVEGS